MKSTLTRAVRLFFHPKSPAAVYRRPTRFLKIISAALVNFALKGDAALLGSQHVQCDICGWTGRFFGAHGAASVDLFEWNVICLRCGSSVRTRVLLSELERRVDLHTPVVIAEGGGSRASAEFFTQYPSVSYQNFDPYKAGSSEASAVSMPLEDESCDAVLSCHVLEHIKEYQRAIREIARLLKPDGVALVIVPQTDGLRLSRSTDESQLDGYGHVWEFGDDFPALLEEGGLKVTELVRFQNETVNVCSRHDFG